MMKKRLVVGKHSLCRSAVKDIARTYHDEHGLRMAVKDRRKSGGEAEDVVAGDATVADMLPTKEHIPVATIFGEFISQHDNIGTVYSTHFGKIIKFLLIERLLGKACLNTEKQK